MQLESLDFSPHQVDHTVAVKHRGETSFENLALCCAICNQFKGTDLSAIDPLTQEVVLLFNPRRFSWDEHFVMDGHLIWPLTSIGRATAELLQFNSPERVYERAISL
jgi:hypothetical protein